MNAQNFLRTHFRVIAVKCINTMHTVLFLVEKHFWPWSGNKVLIYFGEKIIFLGRYLNRFFPHQLIIIYHWCTSKVTINKANHSWLFWSHVLFLSRMARISYNMNQTSCQQSKVCQTLLYLTSWMIIQAGFSCKLLYVKHLTCRNLFELQQRIISAYSLVTAGKHHTGMKQKVKSSIWCI